MKNSIALGLKNGQVKLVANNCTWHELYLSESYLICECLKEVLVAVEHVGSTAIQTIRAKPILDILVIVKADFNVCAVTTFLTTIGYEKGLFQRHGETFYLKSANEIHTHYIHLVSETEDWARYILFRDHLNANPSVAQSYEQLKTELALKFKTSRKEYTASKEQFVENILSQLRKT